MTLAELQALTTAVKVLTNDLKNVSVTLDGFLAEVDTIVNGQFASTIFKQGTADEVPLVDAYVVAQLVVYNQHLTNVEVSADALGTDPFNP